ncbi:hypothetical protein QT972_15095 [Microcoleus sp. herbarium7]|uniref:hypothetical protein n=1 Tax=Microcoleus sp. herbarium7 TaxID=3055435 RepID=UPI002FD247D0
MPEQFTGIVEILNSDSGAVEITLSGGDNESNPFITVGGGEGGSLFLRDSLNRVRIVSNADTASTRFRTEDGEISVFIDGVRGDIRIGGGDRDGNLLLFNRNGGTTVESATIHLDGGNGSLQLRNSAGTNSIFLGGEDSTMLLGNTLRLEGDNGSIVSRSIQLRNAAGANSIFLGGEDSTILLGNTLRLDGDAGNIRSRSLSLGSTSGEDTFLTGSGGSLFIVAPGAQLPTIQFNAQDSSMQVLSILSQSIQLRNSAGTNSIFLGGEDSTMLLGNTLRLEGDNGSIVSRSIQLRNTAGTNSIFLGGEDSTMLLGETLRLEGGRGNIWLGGNGADGDIAIFAAGGDNQTLSQATIHLNGDSGDIILRNADCAEEFDISEEVEDEVEPGTVMVLDTEGKLRQSTNAYDQKVAGVISGAGDYKPGIVLDRQSSQNLRMPVALMGKVYCKVDAQYGAIEVGDLLTTSPTPGHAMKADDFQRAFGAVIGKALKPLQTGCGLVPIIIALQ